MASTWAPASCRRSRSSSRRGASRRPYTLSFSRPGGTTTATRSATRPRARCRLAPVILPATAIEHKLFALPVADARADCTLWSAPDQFAFPLNLPGQWLGFPREVTPLPASGGAPGTRAQRNDAKKNLTP